MKNRFALLGLASTIALGSSGCLMAGNYHSARTLEKGTSSFGLTFSAERYQRTTTDSSGTKTTENFTLPNVIPEMTYHIGVTDDVEVGGRVAIGSLGMEGDVKWRFYHEGPLHLAIAPAIGGQAFVLVEGEYFRLPGILTYDLSDNFSLNLALFTSTTKLKTVDNSATSDFGNFNGTLVSTGAAVGFDLRAETFVIRPSVEFTRWDANLDNSSFTPFNTVNVMVHIAWIGGREKKQMNRMERKMDRILDDTEGRPHNPAEPKPTDDSDYKPAPGQ